MPAAVEDALHELESIVDAYRRLLTVESGIADSRGILDAEDDP